MRRPGFRDAVIAMKLYELRREERLREARDLVGTHLYGASWEDVKPLLEYGHPRNAYLRQVVGYWEMAAAFVLRGMLHPDVYLDVCDEGLFTYAVLEEHLARVREIRPNFLAKTEAIVQEHPRLKGRLMEVRARIFRTKAGRDAPTPEE